MPLLILLLLVIAEIYVLITVGGWIGAGWTILALIAGSVLGALLLRVQGARAWRALRDAANTRRPPHREIADGALIFLGGLLILLPGFISDVLGLLCLLPPTRLLIRKLIFGVALRRVPPPLRLRSSRGQAGRRPDPPVIEGEFDSR